jgi:hypothetical protein
MTQIIDFPEPARAQRRSEARRLCLLGGVAVDQSGSPPRSCTIRDISPDGARVELDCEETLPADFYLIDLKHRLASRAAPAWRLPRRAGLKLREPQMLGAALAPEMHFLATAFVEAKLRQIDVLLSKGFSLNSSLSRAEVKQGEFLSWRKVD